MAKGIYIVLSGSKKDIEHNEERIEEFLNTIKRNICGRQARCATVQHEVEIDKEHLTGHSFKLEDFPKIEFELKGYKAVILKYSHHGKKGRVYHRGRRWRYSTKKKDYIFG